MDTSETMKIYIKKTEIYKHGTNKKSPLQYGLYDSMGFIFTATKTLNNAIDFCIKNKLDYEVLRD